MQKTMIFENGRFTLQDENGNEIATEEIDVVIDEEAFADIMRRYSLGRFQPKTSNVVYANFEKLGAE